MNLMKRTGLVALVVLVTMALGGGLPGIGLGPILSPIDFLPRPPSGQLLQPQICPPLCGQGFPFPRLFGPVPLQ